MASNYTSNYGLCQWQASDKVLRTEFNADNAKIDAAIAAVDSRVDSLNSSKASVSALDSLKTSLSGKADKSALDSLKTTVSQHTSTLSKKGNCTIYTTSYTGTGSYGQANPRSLTFPSKPLVIFLACQGNAMGATLVQGQASSYSSAGGTGSPLGLTWSGSSVSWYNHMGSAQQLNDNGSTYTVTALLKAD